MLACTSAKVDGKSGRNAELLAAELHNEALNVLGELETLSRGQRLSYSHKAFASLYFFSTKNWLSYLEPSEEHIFTLLVIVRFYGLYEKYVLQPIDQERETSGVHWKSYFRLAERTDETMFTKHQHWRLVYLGARAHVRHDLAIAIQQAGDDYKRLMGKDVEPQMIENALFGTHSDKLFLNAALEFTDGSMGRKMHYLEQFSIFTRRFLWASNPVWLWSFQQWRRKATNEAQTYFAT